MSLSKHSFIGRLTRSVEGRDVPVANGETARVASFTVAVDPESRNTNAESDFYNVVVWRQLAQTCEQYLDKGRLVYVEGRPRTRKYDQQKDGVTYTQYISEVIAEKVQFLDRGDNANAQGQEQPAGQEHVAGTRPPF